MHSKFKETGKHIVSLRQLCHVPSQIIIFLPSFDGKRCCCWYKKLIVESLKLDYL